MESVPENKENLTRGCLKLNDKIYPVYEGHNPIGRNPDAVINIKNLNVSKHHGVITIFDENSHYISDFKSANGTILDSERLIPLRLYKLKNGASVKFGDVFCTYKKLEGDKVIENNSEASQQYSENFYGASTQEVQLSNFPEGINFNEMPTQAFTKELNINEMPTQIFNFSDRDDDNSDDSIDFATMKKASESQAYNKNLIEDKVSPDTSSVKIGGEVFGSDTDEELAAAATSASDQVSSTTSTQISPVILNKRQVIDSDTDDEPPPSQIQPVKKTGKKNVIESDSDTEEYVEGSKSKYHISDDSETDIEDDDKENEESIVRKEDDEENGGPSVERNEENENTNGEERNGDSSVGVFTLRLSDSMVSKKALPPDHLYCQSLRETQTQNIEDVLPSEKKREEKNEEREDILKESAQERKPDEIKDKENEEKKIEDALDESTQQLDFNLVDDKQQENINKHLSLQLSEDNDVAVGLEDKNRSGDEDDIFMRSTQTMEDPSEEKEEMNATFKEKEDEMFLLPTQVLENSLNKNNEEAKSEDKEDEDIYLRSTQTLEDLHGEGKVGDNKKSSSAIQHLPSDEKIEPSSSRKEEDDLNLPPTQALEFLHRDTDADLDKNRSEKIVVMEESLTERNEEVEDLFLPPTQALERLLSDDKVSDRLCPKEDVFSPPKQFKEPSPLKRNSFRRNPPEKSPIKEDDDILPPTQALAVMHEDEAHFNQVEDQLHEIFASQSLMCTQQLVDVLEISREDDIIDDSIVQEERSLSLPSLAKPISAESVKEILGEGLDEEVVGGKAPVRTYSRRRGHDERKEDEDAKMNEVKIGEKEKSTTTKAESSKTSNNENIDDKGKNKENPEGNKTSEEETENKETRRGNRRKQNIGVGEESAASDAAETKTDEVIEKRRKRGRPKLEESNCQEPAATTSKVSQNEDTEEKKGRGRPRKNLFTSEQTGTEGNGSEENKRRGRSKDVTPVRETKEDTTDSQNSLDNESRGRRKILSKINEETLRTEQEQDSKGDKTKMKKKEVTPMIEKKESQESTKGRGRRRILADSNEEVNEDNSKNSTDGEKRRGGKKEDVSVTENKKPADVGKEENIRRGRRKLNILASVEDLQSSSSQDSEDKKLGDVGKEENVRRGRRNQNIVASVEDLQSNSAQDSEDKKLSDVGKEENVRRGRRNQNIVASVEKDLQSGSSQDSEDKKLSDVGKEENVRRGRRKLNILASVEDPQSGNSQDSEDRKLSDVGKEENVSRGRRKQNIVASVEEATPQSSSTYDSEEICTRSRRKQETSMETQSSSRTTKRKKMDNVKLDETPTKRKVVTATARKRISVDSEDDFVAKVPKISVTPSRSKRVLTSVRKDNDSVISISSSSSNNEESSERPRRLSANSKRQKKEEEEVKGKQNKTATRSTPVVPTPERSKRILKPKVVFTMMDNPELESSIRQLGGSVVDTVDACTVLVTESVKRSQKLLCAVAQGKPICSPKWLHACKKAFSFVDPWEYILVDEEAEKKWNFSLRESLNRSTKTKLLENYTFQIIVNNGADVLKGAIEACGGKCVTRNLPKCDTHNLVIVSSENNKSKYAKIVKQNPRIIVVVTEAIFDGTLRQEFKFGDHLLI